MLDFMLMQYDDFALHLSGRPVIHPGQPEPEWLTRNAEHARVLAELRAERRSLRAQRGEKGAVSLIARLRLAFGRD